MINLVINGVSYPYPQPGDDDWGTGATAWAQAVTSSMLSLAGGSFPISAQVDFGTNFGIKSLYLLSETTSPAASGVLRLANGDAVAWRNVGGTADLLLRPDADGILQYGGVDLVNLTSTQTLTNKTISGTFTGNFSGNSTGFTGNLSGDVTGTQTATAVGHVGGATASAVASATVAANAATNANTPSAIVARDGSGNFSAGTVTANLVGSVTGNSSGFTGSLNGDVTGTQSATVVGHVGGATASAVASATTAANAATNANNPSTIVARDGSGNFSAGTITANLVGNSSTATTAGNITAASNSSLTTLTALTTATALSSVGTITTGTWQATPIAAAYVATLNQNTTGTAANITATSNGTLTTLSSLTTASALASVGTITSGTWQGTPIGASYVATLNQNTTGTASNVTGTVAIANGGTGQSTKAAAFNALSPITSTGDLIYGSAANTASRLAAGLAGQSLQMISGIPGWGPTAAGGGAKNYLATYTASTASGTANAGNGNFELGTTAGWNLAHTTLSSFIPTSTATAGSAFLATTGIGNVALAVVTSGQLSQTSSGNMSAAATSTAGDMIISSAFYIDLEDQAKMQTITFRYKNVSGATNFSGSTANSFAVWVYDVTNAAWIMPAGVYNLVQSSGVGVCTATFQTTSNSTQYQLALININSVTGAYSLYVDDFVVGPQTAPMGPAVSDSVAYTPNFTGLGTVTGATTEWSRRGEKLFGQFTVTAGTTTATAATITLPAGLSLDFTKISTNSMVGKLSATNTPFSGGLVAVSSSTGTLFFTTDTTAFSTGANGSTWATGTLFSGFFEVPIVGWSSNTSMSSDTDTRVIAATVNTGGGTLSAADNVVKFTTVAFDTAGAYSSSTGLYTVPVSGYYEISAHIDIQHTSGTPYLNVNVYQNGASIYSSEIGSANGTGSDTVNSVSAILKCSAGDTLGAYTNTNGASPSFTAGSLYNWMSIKRLTGPAVITATESVNCGYYANTGQSIGTSLATLLYQNKEWDTHNAYNPATGGYTVPVTGKYRITANCNYSGSGVTQTTTGNCQIGLVQSGSQTRTKVGYMTTTGGTSNYYEFGHSSVFSCLAGDVLVIQSAASIATTVGNGQNYTYMTIERVGN